MDAFATTYLNKGLTLTFQSMLNIFTYLFTFILPLWLPAIAVVYAVVMCLSIHPSLTRRYFTKTAKLRIMQTTPYDTSGNLCFLTPKISAKLQWLHP